MHRVLVVPWSMAAMNRGIMKKIKPRNTKTRRRGHDAALDSERAFVPW
jgi:hypothetical protein